MTANSVQKDPSDQIASLNKPTTNPRSRLQCNKFGGCADPPGLSYPLFKRTELGEGGFEAPLFDCTSRCVLVMLTYLQGAGGTSSHTTFMH